MKRIRLTPAEEALIRNALRSAIDARHQEIVDAMRQDHTQKAYILLAESDDMAALLARLER